MYLSPVAALMPSTLLCPAAALIPLVNSSNLSLTSGMSILLITTTYEERVEEEEDRKEGGRLCRE